MLATQTALKLADYVVTEAGFGADLGAEKFLDIKCRKTGLRPAAAVIVATMRALKYHGGVDLKEVSKENLAALEKGLPNLERHVENVSKVYGIPCVVSINRFTCSLARVSCTVTVSPPVQDAADAGSGPIANLKWQVHDFDWNNNQLVR